MTRVAAYRKPSPEAGEWMMSNGGLLYMLFRRHAPELMPEHFWPLMSELYIKLCSAWGRYDPNKGVINTFVGWQVRGVVSFYKRNLHKSQRVTTESLEDGNDPPSYDLQLLRATENERVLGLRASIERTLGILPEQTAKILRCRFHEGMTLEQTGVECGGITRERVRQIQDQGLKWLRPLLQKAADEYRGAA